MHYECEIDRLTSLLAEEREIIESIEVRLHNAEHLASMACENPPDGCGCAGCWLAENRAKLEGEDDE